MGSGALGQFGQRVARGAAWLAAVALAAGPLGAQSPKPPPETRSAPAPDAQAVERRLTEAVRRAPDSFEAHHTLAEFYLHQGRLAEAIPHLERAQAIDPRHYVNGYDLAIALLEVGRLADARAQVQRLLKAGEKAELHNLLGDIDERDGRLVEAAASYQRAAHQDATEEHLFDWGNNLLRLRALQPAIEVFRAGVTRHPASARLHAGLGVTHYSRGEYEEAVKALLRATDLEPDDPRAYQFLGEMYGVAPGLAGEMTRRLARFARAQPRDAKAQFAYAMSLWKGSGGPVEAAALRDAETHLRRAATLDPTFADAFLQLGILLSDERRFAEAIPALRRATELAPDRAQAYYRLSQAYLRTGQKALGQQALETFERLKAREPAPPPG